MISTPDAARSAHEGDLPTRTYGPPASVVIGSLVVGFVFVVVLEFLVIISFVGQRLWTDPALKEDFLFTLPLLLWVVPVALLADWTARY